MQPSSAYRCHEVFITYVLFVTYFCILSPRLEIGLFVSLLNNNKYYIIWFQWSPDRSSVFGSSAEDGILNIWDHEKV